MRLGLFARISLVAMLVALIACEPERRAELPGPDAPAPDAAQVLEVPAPARRPPISHRSVATDLEPGAVSWQRLNPSSTAGLISAAAYGRGGLYVATTDGELFVIADGSAPWRALRPPSTEPLVDLAVDLSGDRDALVALDRRGRIFGSMDGGDGWQTLAEPPPGLPDASDPVGGAAITPFWAVAARRVRGVLWILAVGQGGLRMVSRDQGATFERAWLERPEPLRVAMIGTDGTMVAAGDRGYVFSLAPEHTEWQDISTDKRQHWLTGVLAPATGVDLVLAGEGGEIGVQTAGTWTRTVLEGRPMVTGLARAGRSLVLTTDRGRIARLADPASGRLQELRKPDGRRIDRVVARDGVLAVAGPALVAESGDDGRTWRALRGDLTATILDGQVLDGNRATFVGRGGARLVWEEGAVVQRPVVAAGVAVEEDLTAVAFAGGKYGWIASSSGAVFATHDGGRTFASSLPFGDQARPSALLALDPRNLALGGSSGLLASSVDGGTTWKMMAWPSGAASSGAGASVLSLGRAGSPSDPQLVVGVERGTLLWGGPASLVRHDYSGLAGIGAVASHGGTTWLLDRTGVLLSGDLAAPSMEVLAVPSGLALQRLAFGGPVGVALAGNGLALRTEDGGARWHLVDLGSDTAINAIVAVGQGAAFVAVGHRGLVLRSSDRGGSWQRVSTERGETLTSVVEHGGRLLAGGMAGTLLASDDGGQTWKPAPDRSPDLPVGDISCLSSDGQRLAVGTSGTIGIRGEAGRWGIAREAQLGLPRSIALTSGGALVISSVGRLFSVDDGGAISPVETRAKDALGLPPEAGEPTLVDLLVSPTSPDSVLALTSAGLVAFRRGPQGAPWRSVTPPRPTRAPASSLLLDGGRVWLAGLGGLWASDDFGATWSAPLAVVPSRPVAATLSSAKVGYLATETGQILRTDDGGQHWQAERTGTRTPLTVLRTGPDGSPWGAGEAGLVLRRPTSAVDSGTSIE